MTHSREVDDFLPDFEGRDWILPDGCRDSALVPDLLYLQDDTLGLQVAVADAASKPKADDVRQVWSRREDGRGFPLMLVVRYPRGGVTTCAVCGPTGEQPKLEFDLDPQAVARVCNAALKRPNRASVLSFLATAEVEEQSGLPGLRNVGLFATHELAHGVPTRSDWTDACTTGRPVLATSGRNLVAALGFEVADRGLDTSVLVAAGEDRAVAVFLEEAEAFDQPAGRFHGSSPVAHALAAADREGLDWVMLVRGSTLRLYPAKPDVGVGRRGRAGTYVEANLDLLPFEQAGYLTLLFSAEALAGDSVAEILESSSIYVAGLGERLRDRVYFDAVPSLATAIAGAFDDTSAEGLRAAYERTMTVLFRLLFVAYGEDKELLPYRTNGAYADRSLTNLAKELTERLGTEQPFDDESVNLWERVVELWTAIEAGKEEWEVPAYGGTLFSTDGDVNPDGAALAGITLTDDEFGPTLTALLVDVGPDGLLGPVDFRSLSVREFGTIYEGLLESELSVARSDLAEVKGNLVPAGDGDQVVVAEGEVYFHNRSGVRKSTGSYFTKPFAVEHLLHHALAPALDDHLDRVRELVVSGDEAGAARALFDFRVADIAMGSGHFLVAAVDHLEARFSRFLADHPVPAVGAELDALRRAAEGALGELADRYRIETTQVLRRLIARRCVYGVDLNPISVELARLGIWIHTFVAGLPLSFLDHNLVAGNSLTGIGTLDEVDDFVEGGLAAGRIREQLDAAQPHLDRLAALGDATIDDVQAAREAADAARGALTPAARLLDMLVLARAGLAELDPVFLTEEEVVARRHAAEEAQDHLAALEPLHFPLAFPEVFAGKRPGFNCILGNPPWEKVHVETHQWWALRFPGIRGLSVGRMNREIADLIENHPTFAAEFDADVEMASSIRQALLRGPFPGLGKSHPDLYKAFGWRFWALATSSGMIGVVLPRSALTASGTAEWRSQVLKNGRFQDVTVGQNRGRWFFDDVGEMYSIALVALCRDRGSATTVPTRGPFRSLSDYGAGCASAALDLPSAGLLEWTSGAAFPAIPSRAAGAVFFKMRDQAGLGDEATLDFRPVQGDLNATTGKRFMELEPDDTSGLWPVYSGAGLNLWEPDTGKRYAWAKPAVVLPELLKRQHTASRRQSSAFHGLSTEPIGVAELPCQHPRIAWRGIARASDSRTVICSLVPPQTILQHTASFFVNVCGDSRAEAFLLGLLSSTPLDWYARCFVEIHVDFHVINAFPVPASAPGTEHNDRVGEIAGRLAAVDDRFSDWAAEVGVPVGSVTSQAEKDDLIAELDAVVAHLYGLNRGDLEIIWGTFYDKTPRNDRRPALERVLEHHERWTEHT